MEILPLSYYAIVTGAGQCAADAINANGGPALARVCLHVPGQIAWDNCACGSFQQTAVRWFYSEDGRTDGGIYVGDDNICSPAYLGLEIQAEVLRCVNQPVEGTVAPTCAALALDSQQWHRDAMAMRRGILCCLQTMRDNDQLSAFTITNPGTAVGPQGMCAGSSLTYRIFLPNCDCE